MNDLYSDFSPELVECLMLREVLEEVDFVQCICTLAGKNV